MSIYRTSWKYSFSIQLCSGVRFGRVANIANPGDASTRRRATAPNASGYRV